ncbi:MAG: flagellar basal body P-ring protein FlgI [Candidatus Dadabacteria bacterium]|nr:MAG: flagellar basal body P-ring protein FlgI [Candidatus Dadabacteria bacterium]
MNRILAGFLALLVALPAAAAVRVKDIARVDGVRRNQLIGYGLVVGLNGTGDKSGVAFTTQSTANLLERLGVAVTPDDIKLKNVAAVIVTAELPPFARAGQRIDVTVSSVGDASSLQGGTLLLTPLRAPNGDVYAVAQGPLSIGGFGAGAAGGGVQQNHPTVGRIPGGALLERDAPLPDLGRGYVDLVLREPDFTTAARLAGAVGTAFGPGTAQALDAGRVRVVVPEGEAADPVGFLARLEAVTVEPDAVARVVVDERTGTVVLGQDVRVRPVALSHGNLTVQITPYLETSQPEALSAGQTVARERAQVTVTEEEAKVLLLEPGETLASLVQALNALGVSPRDLVAIFQALKAAGALQAELEIL